MPRAKKFGFRDDPSDGFDRRYATQLLEAIGKYYLVIEVQLIDTAEVQMKWKSVLLCGLLAIAVPALRADLIVSASAGNLAASATFNITGDTLTVLLTNTASVSPNDAANVLTGLFFTLPGSLTLTPVSALLPAGSSIIQTSNCNANPCVGETNVGGEWSYAFGGLPSLAGTNQGIGSAGYLNANASSGNFNGSDLQTPVALDGVQFGLVNSGFVEFSGNGGLDNNALIRDSTVFTLTGVSGLSQTDISNVFFTYGTSGPTGGEPVLPPQQVIPEPGSIILLGTVLMGVCHLVRRKKQTA